MRQTCTKPDWLREMWILDRLYIIPTIANIDGYRKRWGEHLLGMDVSRIQNIAFEDNPKWRRDVGRPRKRCEL